ncbi:MAG: NSS family neurotransmitter:Na+ symporter [Halieaceae bacterium]
MENRGMSRGPAVLLAGGIIGLLSLIILLNFDELFTFVISLTTRYSQPMLGLVMCIFAGWIWNRNEILSELKKGNPEVESSVFWKIWPWYIKFICPLMIAFIMYQSF